MTNAIITGATGAIGTALINELAKNNVDVLVLCRKNSERKKNIPTNSHVRIKYCSLDELKNIENDTGKTHDVFYHFAWEGTSGTARNDMFLQNKNVAYALDAVRAAKKFGCKKFIGAGSQAEYGRVNGILKPDTPVNPDNGYGIAKLCAGLMTKNLSEQLGLEFNWVRILSVYGENDGKQSMVMSTIEKLKSGETPQFTKGEQIWDYLYSKDAAKALYLLADNGKDGKTYVLGSGNGKPLAEYIEEIRKIVNPQAKINLGAIPYSDKQIMYLCADITELHQDTGWKAETTFSEGIREILKTI